MDKTTSAIMATLCLTGTTLGTTSMAADAPEFTSMDKDKDGYVSREEARIVPEIMQLFARVDANQDGQLSTVEYREAVRQLQS
jgi:Ca2+-binding EF-hand superfamily protein